MWERLTNFDPLGSTTLSRAHQLCLPTVPQGIFNPVIGGFDV
jgi:hypothetical protein